MCNAPPLHAEKLNSNWRPDTTPLPIGAALTGFILVNTFYWCTNQGIVQRTLASKSLAEGQKGALLTAVLKMLDPLVLVLPGVIAFHLIQDLPKADMAYPTLVKQCCQLPLVGFSGAVLFGAVISTFYGFLNSAQTLFSMGIYRRLINEQASPRQVGQRWPPALGFSARSSLCWSRRGLLMRRRGFIAG